MVSVAIVALTLTALTLTACRGDATRTNPCIAPIAGVCTTNAPNANAAHKPTGPVGGGPLGGGPQTPVVVPSGADAGVAMPQFEYGPDGSVRVGPR
jgi:hypothetical protein